MMFQKISLVFLFASLSLALGCSTVIDATTDEPIDMDPERRTVGTSIDDAQIETIAHVNLNKAHPDLKAAPVTVTSYNRVVLLTGQVRNNELRNLATETVTKLSKVRQVHNELEVLAPVSFLATVNDAWLTSKIKTKLLTNDKVRSNRMKVITENATVYLMGMVPRAEAEHAAQIASSTSGVQKVVLAVEYVN